MRSQATFPPVPKNSCFVKRVDSTPPNRASPSLKPCSSWCNFDWALILRLTDFGLARNDPLPGPFDEIFRRSNAILHGGLGTGPSLSSVPLVNARQWGPSRPLLPKRYCHHSDSPCNYDFSRY